MPQEISAKKKLRILREKYPNNNTYSSYIVKEINLIKDREATNKKIKKALETYRKELLVIRLLINEKKKDQLASDNDKENFIKLETLRKMWELAPNSLDKLITGFYIFYPALRTDWADVYISENKFVFPRFIKEDKGGSKTKPIIDEFIPLLKFVPNINKNHSSFASRIVVASEKIFRKKIGINLYRKIWVFEYRGRSIKDREELAKSMNHTIDTSRMNYEKIDLDIKSRTH